MSARKNRCLKILTLALIAIFALATAFGFAACGGESNMTDKDASKLNDAVQNSADYDQSVTVEISDGENKFTYAYNAVYSVIYIKAESGDDSVEIYVRSKMKSNYNTATGETEVDYYGKVYFVDDGGGKSMDYLYAATDFNVYFLGMSDILGMSGFTLGDNATVSAWESDFLSLVGADGSTAVESKTDGKEYSFSASVGSETIGVKSKKITSVDIVKNNGASSDEFVATISYSYDADLADASFGLLNDKDANGEDVEDELWLAA